MMVLGDICEVCELNVKGHIVKTTVFYFLSYKHIVKSTMKGIFCMLLMYLCLRHWLDVKNHKVMACMGQVQSEGFEALLPTP